MRKKERGRREYFQLRVFSVYATPRAVMEEVVMARSLPKAAYLGYSQSDGRAGFRADSRQVPARGRSAIATAGFKSVSCSMGAICSVGPAGGANGPITFDGVAGV